MDLDRPLDVWTVSDGRAGIDNQVIGLAEAVASLTPATITKKRIGWKAYLDPLPPWAHPAPDWGRSSGSSAFQPPWPDLWIGAGRASLPIALRIRKRSGRGTFFVQLQDPRLPSDRFDLVAPPAHDRLGGPGVFPIIGSPHRVTPERLADAKRRFDSWLRDLPRPRVAVLIGGKSKTFDLPPARARQLADQIDQAVRRAGGSVMATFSRRTPETARAVLTERLSALPGRVWDGAGENPYFAFLEAADFIIVTKDSVNMVAEAAATGKPIYIADVKGDQWRKRLFHADLRERGVARPFEGVLEPFAYPPLRETDRLAREILRRLDRAPEADAVGL